MHPLPTSDLEVERIQLEPVAFMYHDGPTPQEIPGDMMGTICFSRKRLFNCRNETPLYTRPAPAVAPAEVVRELVEALMAAEVIFAELGMDEACEMCRNATEKAKEHGL